MNFHRGSNPAGGRAILSSFCIPHKKNSSAACRPKVVCGLENRFSTELHSNGGDLVRQRMLDQTCSVHAAEQPMIRRILERFAF
jgi:hypothetical protein